MKNNFDSSRFETKEKPAVLYVSAQTKGIEELVPMEGRNRGEDEGSVIFSTPDKALASIFLVNGHNDSWMQIGYFNDILVVIIKSDREEFIKNDRGGSMYTVSSETFDFDPDKGMGEKEWTSSKPVRTQSETNYSSALETMTDNGVQVYFVDEETFDEINRSRDHGLSILLNEISDNERRGNNNFKSLKDLDIDEFKKRPIEEFDNLRGEDLSNEDLSRVEIGTLLKCDFDTETKWPTENKMPAGFNPVEVLITAQNPGLGIQELHAQGIDGRGVIVAIIDQVLSSSRGRFDEHSEYGSKIIDYKEFGVLKDEEISMHGPAVTSLLVGEKCGVAPKSEVVYRAVQSAERDFNLWADALLDIIELNKTLPDGKKVKIVSCSIGFRLEEKEDGLDRWIETINLAEKAGIVVSDVGDRTGVKYIGGGSSVDKENPDSYDQALFLGDQDGGILKDSQMIGLIKIKDIDGIMKRIRELKPQETDGVTDKIMRNKIETFLNNDPRSKFGLIVPSDYRTMASRTGSESYMYNGKGGMSWAVPYLSGIFALVWQIKPDLKKEQIAEIINKTVTMNKDGNMSIINPKGIIEQVRNM